MINRKIISIDTLNICNSKEKKISIINPIKPPKEKKILHDLTSSIIIKLSNNYAEQFYPFSVVINRKIEM